MLFLQHKKIKQILSLTTLLISTIIAGCTKQESITVGITSTLDDSGVISLLSEAFKKEYNIDVKAVVAGSGQIHRLIESNDVDTAITHDPIGEKKLLEQQLVTERLPLVKNSFLIVGPKDDPAHIAQSITPDEAFEKITFTKQLFVSRNDNSGTHQMEKKWRNKLKQNNADSLIIKTGTGMGATLAIAIEKKAYTLVDRGTWYNFNDKQTLKVLFDDPDLLPNQYSLLSLPKSNAKQALPKSNAKQEYVKQWEAWLSKGEGLTLLKNYRVNGKIMFD